MFTKAPVRAKKKKKHNHKLSYSSVVKAPIATSPTKARTYMLHLSSYKKVVGCLILYQIKKERRKHTIDFDWPTLQLLHYILIMEKDR